MIEKLEVEIEQLVLASVLIEPKYIKKCILDIEPTDFEDYKNREIYHSMLRLYNKPLAIDYRTLLDDLTKHKTGVDIDYLIELTNMLPTAENLDTYILQLREQSNRRKLLKGFSDIEKDKSITSEEAVNYISNIADSLNHVNNTPTELIHKDIDIHVNNILDGKALDIAHKTLYHKLDERLAITDGGYYVIGARPAVGKSAHVLNLANNFLLQGKKVLLVSLEMTRYEVLNRLLSMISGVDSMKISRRKGLTPSDKIALAKAQKVISNYNLNVYDRGGLKIEALVGLCNKLKQQNKLDIIILDYIGLMSSNEFKGQRANQIGYISRNLKQIAMDLRIPVIALSQLNRNISDSSSGKQREPNLTDIRDSGSVEQDANAVMFLYSTKDNEKYDDRYLILKVAKNRNGTVGNILMVFHTNTLTFREYDYDTKRDIALDKIGG